ncbi:MAG: glycosyltransferase family 4 protein, partial [candidate division WOR-3 bacterium]|nr:glycosyltransferase family 4 protein [candidate division WOR-3 bacterium]
MKILVINWRCIKNPLAGGAEIYFQEIFKRIVKVGHSVTQLAVKFEGAQEQEIIDGIKIIRIGSKNTFNFAVYHRLDDILRQDNYDIVIDDLNKIPFYSPWITKKPVLALMMHLFRKSIFSEVSIPFASYVYLMESLIPLCYKHNNFATLSESSKQDLVKMGIKAEKIAVIPPGIDLSVYQPDYAIKEKNLILHTGRLKRYKSVDHLLYATQKLSQKRKDFKVVIIGDGDDFARLKNLTKKLDIEDYITFTGYIPEKEKIKYYQKANVLVENSIKEGWGMIVIEANACGTPVVAARSPGLKDA